MILIGIELWSVLKVIILLERASAGSVEGLANGGILLARAERPENPVAPFDLRFGESSS
jgi:hypothetical protein